MVKPTSHTILSIYWIRSANITWTTLAVQNTECNSNAAIRNSKWCHSRSLGREIQRAVRPAHARLPLKLAVTCQRCHRARHRQPWPEGWPAKLRPNVCGGRFRYAVVCLQSDKWSEFFNSPGFAANVSGERLARHKIVLFWCYGRLIILRYRR